MYRIEIDELPPSLNAFYGGMHWAARKKIVDEWHRTIWLACKAAKLPKTLQTPLTLSVTQYCKGVVRDADNAVVGAKLFGDTLKECGYIPDDGPAYIPTVILTTKKGKENKLVVVIQALEIV